MAFIKRRLRVAAAVATTSAALVLAGAPTPVTSPTPADAATPAAKKAATRAQIRRAKENWRFPIRGPHFYGGYAATFNALREDGTVHRGQDVFADCGTPLVAVHKGIVLSRGYSPGTGHYLVLDGLRSGKDFVYAHLNRPTWARFGTMLRRGQRIGGVGKTGMASNTCHLHFEIWRGEWYGGGKRIDPLPRLKFWDLFS